MSNSGSGSQISNQDQPNHFRLRIEFFQFEKTTIQEHLRNYIEKVQRQHCEFSPPDAMILSHHDLLEFMLLGEETSAPAFDFYHVQLQLVQQLHTSRIFFVAQLIEENNYFANSSYIDSLHQPLGVQSTIFKLNTENGFLETPKLSQLTAQNEIIVAQFKLTILLENFSFAPQPFTEFTQVEVKRGCLHFPLIPSCQGGQNPVQQQHFHVPPMFNPPLAPLRLMRDDTNMSVPWDSDQQSFMSRDQAKHLSNVKAMFNNKSHNRSSSVPQPQSQPPQPGSQPQNNASGPTVGRPVLPNLLQKGFLKPIPSTASSVHANIPPAQPGLAQPGVPPPPPAQSSMGAAGGTNHLPSQPLINDPDIDLPRITMNLPSFYHTGYGDQGRRFRDPRNVLFHDNNDLVWDNSYQIQLSNDVDHHIPVNAARPSSCNPFVQYQPPPLASSDPKYQSVPLNFYGSVPAISYASTLAIVHTSPQAISHQPNAFPTQTTVSQPILPGSLGPQTVMSGTTTTVTSLQTPVLAPSQIAPTVITPVSTGARPKIVMSPPPPSILQITDHILTRSLTGNSKPVQTPRFVQSVKKSLTNSVKNKQEKGHKTRSISK